MNLEFFNKSLLKSSLQDGKKSAFAGTKLLRYEDLYEYDLRYLY